MTVAADLLVPDLCEGEFRIDGVSLHIAGCWNAFRLEELTFGADLSGADVPVPGVGEAARARVEVGRTVTLPVIVGGQNDRNGSATWGGANPSGSADLGVLLNLQAFLTLFVTPPATIAGTRTGQWVLPDGGGTLSESITDVRFDPRRKPGALYVGNLTFKLLGGRFL